MKRLLAWYQRVLIWIEDNAYITIPVFVMIAVASFWIVVYEIQWLAMHGGL